MCSHRWLPWAAVAVLGLGACDSKVTSTVDQALLARINTLQDCFPNLYQWVDGLLVIADTWRLQDGNTPADPAGLTFSFAGGGVDVSLTSGATTISMQIRFYGPGGALQDVSAEIAAAATLADAIDLGATELRDRFGTGLKFIHGVWSISGGGISASGEGLTGIIGGATNQNELQELRTTLAAVSGGVPAVDTSTVIDGGPPLCTLSFNVPGLFTDQTPGQEYPTGTVTATIVGPDGNIDATVVFNGTAIVNITVDDVPGSFDFDVTTRAIPTYRNP